ncbi:TRAP transporter small permease [Ruegeria sp. HKCCA5426]|uniref:TRAP transporter small permease n=1 Tax=Ruegeria sp. HKCCA5426 TaxID=2682985 RepID=UPI001C2C8EDC|nr:TRAP transporter small permease [Ruegeria sp. HKCCA5426]
MLVMGLTVVEVIGRYIFNAPIFGRQDLAQILLALSIFFAFPVVTLRREQIDVDLLDHLFTRRAAFWRNRCIDALTSLCLLTMAVWLFARADKALERGATSELLFIPKYPLIYFIALIVSLTGVLLAVSAFLKIIRPTDPEGL